MNREEVGLIAQVGMGVKSVMTVVGLQHIQHALDALPAGHLRLVDAQALTHDLTILTFIFK